MSGSKRNVEGPASDESQQAKAVAKGDDPLHDLSEKEKDKKEPELRAKAREAYRQRQMRQRNRFNARADEISRAKAKRAHQGRD